jgi:hypothetical protein
MELQYTQADINQRIKPFNYQPPSIKKVSKCRCDKNHRNIETWLKCYFKFYHDNGENKHLPSVGVREKGYQASQWAVYKIGYSGDYYTEHNGKKNNCGYYIYSIVTFDTQTEALRQYHSWSIDQYEDDSVEPFIMYICRNGSPEK